MPYPGEKPKPGGEPGIPEDWDNFPFEPYNPEDPENGGGEEMVDSYYDANGNLLSTPERVTRAEYDRRFALRNQQAMSKFDPNAGGGEGGANGNPQSMPASGLPYRPSYKFDPVPLFNAPEFKYDQTLDIPEFRYDHQFAPPKPGDIYDDPSYQFRYDQGAKAAQQAAAAKGTSRTGGQWKAMQDYGQNFASQEYGNIYGRARDTYGINFGAAKDAYDRMANEKMTEFGTNYGVARDVFDRNYTGAKDEYSPLFSQWQMRSNAEMRGADLGLQNMWREWERNNPSWVDYNTALGGYGR